MKKILNGIGKRNNLIAKDSAGISVSAGFLPQVQKAEQAVMKVGFICNAGLGSSAMGATLFRRKLQELGIVAVDVKAYPADDVPGDLTIAVCQRDFLELTGIGIKAERVFTVENLLNQSEYAAIAREIRNSMA